MPMSGETVATLVNLGTGGAVVAVVLIFLKFIKERDHDWRHFFTTIRQADTEANTKLANVIEKLVDKVERLDVKFDQHAAIEMEVLRDIEAGRKTTSRRKNNAQPG